MHLDAAPALALDRFVVAHELHVDQVAVGEQRREVRQVHVSGDGRFGIGLPAQNQPETQDDLVTRDRHSRLRLPSTLYADNGAMKFSMMWPLHWLGLLTCASDFTANPVMGSARLNAMGLHVLRKRAAHAVCEWRRRRLRQALDPHVVQALSRDGLVKLEQFLPHDEFMQLKSELASAALPMLEMAQPPALTRRANLDAHTCEGRYPALHRLITDRRVLGLLHYAAGYRGCPIIAVQCVHSHSERHGPGHDPQTDWHADTFHSTAKAWLFLHEVGPQEGPFGYVPGSHLPTPARLEWERRQSVAAREHPNPLHAKGSFRVSEADLAQLGYGSPFIGAVPANTLVVADTGGFHRRTPSPHPSLRVEVYLSLRRNPFFAGLFPSLLGLPLLRNRWAGWAFAIFEYLLRKGRPGWIPMPERGLNTEEVRALR
jgi:hypothetical protein